MSWAVREHRADAASLVALEPSEPIEPAVWLCSVRSPTLVLGSTQAFDAVDTRAAADLGVEVVRRRSGGGAVLLWPGEVHWIDVVVPAASDPWDDDITQTSMAIGEAWCTALAASRIESRPLEVWRGGLTGGELARLVCFAGLGPGELTVADAKLVGLAQRRTKRWARVGGLVHENYRAETYARLLSGLDGVAAGSVQVATASGADIGTRLAEALAASIG